MRMKTPCFQFCFSLIPTFVLAKTLKQEKNPRYHSFQSLQFSFPNVMIKFSLTQITFSKSSTFLNFLIR